MLHPARLFFQSLPWRQQALCLAPLACLLLLIALYIGTGQTVTRFFLDAQIRLPRLEQFMSAVSDGANPAFYLFYLLLLIKGLYSKNRQLIRMGAAFALAQLLITTLLVEGVKFFLGCPRPLPELFGAERTPFVIDNDFHSFPSGHTSKIVCSALPLAGWLDNRSASLSLGAVVALVGFSRIFLTRHHLVDIAGGMFFGAVAATFIHLFRCRESS